MSKSNADAAISSLHRGVLGVLLAFLGLFTFEFARQSMSSNRFVGVIGLLATGVIVVLIGGLFLEGLREGAQ